MCALSYMPKGCPLRKKGGLSVDGKWNAKVVKRLQELLNDHWDVAGVQADPLTVNGEMDETTTKALQTLLCNCGVNTTIDGKFGIGTKRSFQKVPTCYTLFVFVAIIISSMLTA